MDAVAAASSGWLCLSRDTHYLCLGIGQVSPGLLVAHWFELVFAISSGENFEVEFEVTVVAIEP